MRRVTGYLLAGMLVLLAPGMATAATDQTASGKVQVTGEVIDSWCYLSEIMYALGTAHHQCAVWCAAGGIPVGLLADDGQVYVIAEFMGSADTLAHPELMQLQTHRITVDGSVETRDGLNYLSVDAVLADEGVVNITHEEYGIQPFGE